MICEACEGEGYVRGKDPENPGALVMLPCLECNGSGIASCCDAAGSALPNGVEIREATDEEQRDTLRHAVYAYRDDSYPERACDRCGKPYRGPAVYCSLACAQADA